MKGWEPSVLKYETLFQKYDINPVYVINWSPAQSDDYEIRKN